MARSSHSEISIFPTLFLLEVVCINTSEISKKSLESIVKTSGDGIVTGYVRFKKIKPIEGYQKACERARIHLSKITGARRLKDGTYALVVRFRLIVFIIPVLIGLLFWLIGRLTYKAEELPPKEYINPEQPTVIVAEEYVGKYISVPGIRETMVTADIPQMELYNPAINDCTLLYKVFYEEAQIGQSGYIYPGQKELVTLNLPENKGVYEVKVIAKGYSFDRKTAYNSLVQKVMVNYV